MSITLFKNARPWLLIRQPNRHTTENRVKELCHDFALLSGIAVASDHLEKWSVMVTIY